jgi:release factor glutamine methyltransferase
VLASDICPDALAVAQTNAGQLKLANVHFCQSHWFENIPKQQFDVIVSNPPYIAQHDAELDDNVRKYEPLSALHSGAEGLADIQRIIQQSQDYLKPGGWLLFEHGYTQAEAIQALLKQFHFSQISTVNDLNHLARVTQATRR